MSIAAARTFITAVKATRAEFAKDKKGFYDKFVRGNAKPDADDIKALTDIIEQAEAIAKVYHADVAVAMAGFGGSGDTDIRSLKTMLETLEKKAAQ